MRRGGGRRRAVGSPKTAQAQIQVLVRRILRKYGNPPSLRFRRRPTEAQREAPNERPDCFGGRGSRAPVEYRRPHYLMQKPAAELHSGHPC
jgi:hypothetical protein